LAAPACARAYGRVAPRSGVSTAQGGVHHRDCDVAVWACNRQTPHGVTLEYAYQRPGGSDQSTPPRSWPEAPGGAWRLCGLLLASGESTPAPACRARKGPARCQPSDRAPNGRAWSAVGGILGAAAIGMRPRIAVSLLAATQPVPGRARRLTRAPRSRARS
jgi:hypothetical protein